MLDSDPDLPMVFAVFNVFYVVPQTISVKKNEILFLELVAHSPTNFSILACVLPSFIQRS